MLEDDRGTDADKEQAAEDFRTLAGDGAENAAEHDADSDHHEGRQADRGSDPADVDVDERQADADREGVDARREPVSARTQNEWLCGRSSTSLSSERKPTHIMRAPSPARSVKAIQ
jgi:hypothetical protein